MKIVLSDTGKKLVCAAALAAAAGVAGCGPDTAQGPAAQAPHVPPQVSVDSLMTGAIAPVVATIWDGGYAPDMTEEDWQRMEQASIQLASLATVLSLGGTGPNDAEWAAASDWQEWSRDLADAALTARRAAQARDQDAFAGVGDTLVELCESCHVEYLPGAR